ncbi:Plectin/S10 domain [Popillia japonica]|uniref:Plectin/S10 domain n=1 Tax=Popillia japonica TaxID=7064 RepID=A0AAW1JXR7_POPJA
MKLAKTTIIMLMPKRNRVAIYEYLFKEGVMVAKKDYHAPKHPELEQIPNLQVIKALQSLKSRGYVKEQFAWRHFYWYLTNEGIEYLRTYLHLPAEIVPASLKRQMRLETARPRGAAAVRSETSKPSEDRAGYRRTPGGAGGPDKKADVGAGTGDVEFRGGFGRGRPN